MGTVHADFQPLRFSTASLPERDRVAAWRDFFGPAVFRSQIEPVGEKPFHADVVARRLPGVTLVSSVISSARFARTPSLADDDGVDLFINSNGGKAWQAGRGEIELRGGEAYLADASQAGAFASLRAAQTHCFHLRIARADIRPLTAHLDEMFLRPFPADTGAFRYMLNYIRIALNDSALADSELAGTAAIHLRDLFVLAIGATRDAAFVAKRRGLQAARMKAIKRIIADNLCEPWLAVDAVATRLGVSSRSVQRMFEEEGTTFSEYVLQERLDRAYRDLIDPNQLNRPVIDVALGAGFGDLSYFNRRFRRRFGAPPSWFRGAGQG